MNTEEIEYILNRHLKDFDGVFSSNISLVCNTDPAYTSRTVMENILTHLDVDLM